MISLGTQSSILGPLEPCTNRPNHSNLKSVTLSLKALPKGQTSVSGREMYKWYSLQMMFSSDQFPLERQIRDVLSF